VLYWHIETCSLKVSLLTIILLLTTSCSGGSETETAQVPTSAPIATIASIPTATPTPTTPDSEWAGSCPDIFPNAVEVSPKEYFQRLDRKTGEVHNRQDYSYVAPDGNGIAKNGPFLTWYFEMFVKDLSTSYPKKFNSFKFGDLHLKWENYTAYSTAVCEAYQKNSPRRTALLAHGKLIHWNTDWSGHASHWKPFKYIDTGPTIIKAPSPPGLEHYTKYITGGGVIIVGGDNVPDAAMLATRKRVVYITSARPEFRNILKTNETRISLFGPDGDVSVLPEYPNENESGGFAQGLTDASMTANAGWLCYPGNWNTGGDPVLHEMVHTINHIVFEEINETYFYERIHDLAVTSIKNGVFNTEYLQNLSSGESQSLQHYVGEYWAITVEGYLMNKRGFKSSHDTREWIAEHDPELLKLITRYFPTKEWDFCPGIDDHI